ncbi:MAG: hypothetical protein F9K29_10770 [Hyphomicrobiaceae bacterium]|nr:MAG: hypothetical protein F9K29_10770 [Hyphomicrobiaceae bacterium]
MAHVRGLHETCAIPTAQGRSSEGQRSKLTAKLARFDHQRALLERQLAVWTEKQKVTRNRLNLLEKEMERVGRLIRECRGSSRAAKRRKRAYAPATDGRTKGDVAQARHCDVSVEY